MAWPTPTLDDLILTHDTGGKRWLHALCLAVNERQNGLGLTRTQFNKGSGGTGTFLDIDDFTGLWIGGENDGAITNLNLCMTAIKAMLSQTTIYGTIGSWLQTTGLGATAWSLSSLESDIGLGTFPNACDSCTDLNFWKQIHGALDRMTICRKLMLRGGTSLEYREGYDASDPEVSWDLAVADTPSSEAEDAIGWYGIGFGGSSFVVVLRNNCSCSFANSCSALGTIDEAYYVVSTGGATPDPDWEIAPSGGTVISVPENTIGNIAAPDIALASSNFTQYRYTSEPSDLPTSPATIVSGNGYWCAMFIAYADVYITPYLTDQV